MQIEFFFTCRECGADVRVSWDTSHFGEPVELKCSSSRCGHVSGELTPACYVRVVPVGLQYPPWAVLVMVIGDANCQRKLVGHLSKSTTPVVNSVGVVRRI